MWTLLDGEGVWKHMFQNWTIKKISICDLFYMVVFDTIGPLMAIRTSNKYVLIAIDHYFKWCETKPIKEHTIEIIIKFLKNK
jgi:2-hydroxy-3-keto-5-methylthiopentenyl-1-phosphate phosphatase